MNDSSLSQSVISTQLEALKESGKSPKKSPGALGKKEPAKTDSVSAGMEDLYKSLTVLADEVLQKLEEILGDELPDGIASLKPEDHTAEATAQRIVDGTTALFAIYAKQNPELKGEELVESFMSTIRSGIKSGYEDAMGVLGSIGALDLDNVSSGIEKTMQLVEEKLQAFEEQLRVQLGITAKEEEPEGADETEGSTPEPKQAQPSPAAKAVIA